MILTILVTGIFIYPPIHNVMIYHNVTLTCAPYSLIGLKMVYQWYRVDGDIPSKAMAIEDILTIPNITPGDQGQYYCSARQFSVHCATSNNATVIVNGEKIYNIM